MTEDDGSNCQQTSRISARSCTIEVLTRSTSATLVDVRLDRRRVTDALDRDAAGALGRDQGLRECWTDAGAHGTGFGRAASEDEGDGCTDAIVNVGCRLACRYGQHWVDITWGGG